MINKAVIKTITIISIFGGIASILGLIGSIITAKSIAWYEILGFAICLLLSIFVLLVPENIFEKNIKSKIRVYDPDATPIVGDQMGKFTIYDTTSLEIEFEIPFTEIPSVQIINFEGHARDLIPTVSNVTIYKATVSRKDSTPWGKKFKWVARGKIIMPKSL
jgi:hypothetical protein